MDQSLNPKLIENTKRPTHRRDTADLLKRVDLRQLAAERYGQPVKHHPGYDVFYSPWRNDGSKASFTVYPTRYKDYGGGGESGHAIDWLMREYGWTFAQAAQHLDERLNGSGQPLAARPAQDRATATGEPPDISTQNTFRQLLQQAQAYLWSDRPDAKNALAYLRGQRHLTDDTIRHFGLGFNPRWRHFAQGGAKGSLPPGIVIPVEGDGAIWALRVRVLQPQLIDEKGKYLNATGSKLTGSLFNGDAIRAGQPVIMPEGEFDAMLIQQTLGIEAVTLGPASNHLARRWHERLKAASDIYLIPDNDEAGDTAAHLLIAALGNRARRLAMPTGKDVTEFIQQGGDLRSWYEAAARFCWWSGGMPDSWRSALLQYSQPRTAPVADLLNEAMIAGLVDPQRFTITDVLEANAALKWNIAENTLRAGIDDLTGLFLQKLETGFIGTDSVSNFRNNSNRGRKSMFYRALTLTEMRRNLVRWATPRIMENEHPAQGANAILAPITATMIEQVTATVEQPRQVAQEVRRALAPIYQQQPRRSKRAERIRVRLIQSLDDLTSSPLPSTFSKSKPADYRRAFAHAYSQSRGGSFQASRRELQSLFGVSNGTVGKLVRQAGLEADEQYTSVPISSPDDIARQISDAARKVQGRPLRVQVERPGQPMREMAYEPDAGADWLKAELRSGATVQVKYQVANRYRVVMDEPVVIEAVTRSPRPPLESRPPAADTPLEIVRPHYGPDYDPRWILAQLRFALHLLGWQMRNGQLVDPSTGEIAPDHPQEIIEIILGRRLAGDSLYECGRDLGARIIPIERASA